MDKKNLPIGTVCDISSNSKKIMIIGYVAVEYENDLIKHDYYGCPYPQGVSGISKIIMFDAIDIENIYFTGYETEESNNLLKKISNINLKIEEQPNNSSLYNNQQDLVTPAIEIKKPIVSNGFIFDEDGYIIKEDQEKLKNPFVQNNISKPEETVKENKWDIFKNLKFDENGVVVADGTETNVVEEIEQPVVIPEIHQEAIKNIEIKEIPSSLNNIKFDENGVVVADGNENTVTQPSSIPTKLSGIRFDENGVVVADGNENTVTQSSIAPTKFSGIKFDENGVVVADGNENNNNQLTPTDRFNKIKFDENGFIVQE